MKVRMMLPMTVRCQTCGEFMYKGTKFNCKKEDVVGETYLGLQIFRFYMRCRKCSAEITYLTDPQNLDYRMEHGATRNFEQWKQDQSIEEALKQRRDAEDEDKVKRLENKTEDAKREMDMMEVLDDMLHTKGQHASVTADEAVAALKARADDEARAKGIQNGELTAEDEAALEAMVAAGKFTRRIEDDYDDDAREGVEGGAGASGVGGAMKRIAPAAPRRAAKVKVQRAALRIADAAHTEPKAANAAANGANDATVAPAAPALANASNGAAVPAADGVAGASASPAGKSIDGTAHAAAPSAGSKANGGVGAAQGLGLGGYGGSSSSEGSGGASGS